MENLTGVRILAVDDSKDTREVLAILLGLQGAEVTAVGSAGEALEAMHGATFDAFICDISLPDGNGYELMQTIRLIPGAHGPAVAMTGFSGDEVRGAAVSAGFQRQLTKPVDFDELLAVIAELVSRETL